MRQTRKAGQIRRRLVAGLFCISLFAADVTTVIPVWASTAVEAGQAQGVGEEASQSGGEEGAGLTQKPDEGNMGDDTQDSGDVQSPDDGKGGDGEQDSGDGKDEDDTQSPDDGKDGDGEQDPGDGKDEDDTQSPDDGKDGDGVTDDPEESDVPVENETPDTEEADSVSENTLETQVEASSLAVSADVAASGTSGNISWELSKDSILTISGIGDYELDADEMPPWSNIGYIKSVVVDVSDITSTRNMFNGLGYVSIDVSKLDTSKVTDMSGMFQDFSTASLDVGSFDTGNVKNMSHMFDNCHVRNNIDLRSFDTGNVTDMSYMFYMCENITLNLTGFNTKNVRNMSYMFATSDELAQGEYLTRVNLSSFDTGNVTDMSHMFQNSHIEKLDLSSFDTSKVTDMSYMFASRGDEMQGSKEFLTEVDLSSFDTGNVTDMSHMFEGSHIKKWDISGIKTGNVTDMSHMFERSYIDGLDFRNFDTGKVTDMSYMFYDCGNPYDYGNTSLDLANFDTRNVKNMSFMFAVGSRGIGFDIPPRNFLTDVDLSSFDTSNVTDMSHMFKGSHIEELDLSGFNFSSVMNMDGIFVDEISLGDYTEVLPNENLRILNLGDFNISRITNISHMFEMLTALTSVNIDSADTSNVTNMSNMFYGCSSLESLDLSSFDTGKVTNMRYMFYDCNALKTLDVSGFDTSKVTEMRSMFEGCGSLTSLDLSGFDLIAMPDDKYGEVLGGCKKMEMIFTPYHVTANAKIGLPKEAAGDKWYRSDNQKVVSTLPEGLDHSIMLTRNKVTEAAARITARKTKTAYTCGETITANDLTVMYYGNDGSVRKLTQTDGYTTNVSSLSTEQPGEKSLVVTYEKDGTKLTTEIILTVTYGLDADTTTVTLPAESGYDYIYDGTAKEPKPLSVSYFPENGGITGSPVLLEEGTDYTVSYRSNINAYELSVASDKGAAPAVIIKGIGSYSGSVTKAFTIHKAAAPAAAAKNVIAARCTRAQADRKIDLKSCFSACGKKTDYEILSVEDEKGIFSQPFTAYIVDGVLTYSTRAARGGDRASIKIKVSFQNYEDAELTVHITMAEQDAAVISGITMAERMVYSGMPVSYSGEAVVKEENGIDITEKVSLTYHYSGVMADGTAYPAPDGDASKPPVDAGSYILTVSVKNDDREYVGSEEYPFTITKAAAVVRAKDVTVLMHAGGGTVPVEQDKVGAHTFGYEATGLLKKDALKKEPAYRVTTDEEGKNAVTELDISKTGIYYIHLSGADAGMNYELEYRPGVLTVSEERVAYTVTFDGMGHCDGFKKRAIRSGALLELSDSERMPEAKEQGYVFAGWYRDRTFAKGKEWRFDTDTVQSDLTLYACWLTAVAEDGNGLKLCVQEIPDLAYTGSAQKPAVTVYDGDGRTLLKAGRDYTVKYVRNTDAVAVDETGRPTELGGTARVTDAGEENEQITDVIGHFSKDCPYVVITGKGNYKETIYRNFQILPARIAADADGGVDDTPLAAGFTLKYTEQLVVNTTKEQQPFGSMKYRKGMKAGTDFTVSIGTDTVGASDASGSDVPADWKAEGVPDAGNQYILPAIPRGYTGTFILTVTGKGNYTGVIRKKLYVAEKQKLMKNASLTLGKNQKSFSYTGGEIELTPGYHDATEKKYYKVTAPGTVNTAAEENADEMFLVKAGKNGKAGGEGLVWGRDYTIDYAGTNRAAGTATMTLTGINGYVGTKSVTFKITGTKFAANTVDIKVYDEAKPNEPQTDAFRASMSYTGKALTQNKVTLKTKVTKDNSVAKELTYGEHYTISYKNNIKKGNAIMTFTAKPASGYTGSFKKTFKITPQTLAGERLTVQTKEGNGLQTGNEVEATYKKNGAKLSFTITNEAGTELLEGVDYTVKYKNNNAVTAAQTEGNKKPLMTVVGKGNYAGNVEVPFTVVQASLAEALDEGIVQVSCAQVQKKDGMKFKDFKFRLAEGKKTLAAGEEKDYIIDETRCSPEKMKAYADALEAEGVLPEEPSVTVRGRNNYGGEKTIALGKYIYAEKLTSDCVYVVISEGAGQSEYTGGQVTPDITVYYGEKAAVSAAKKDKVRDEAALTAESGMYKLKKLETGDYAVSYGANMAAGKNKGSVTITGAGSYGGSVTVKFEIGKKSIC